jgi:hypothetical protein
VKDAEPSLFDMADFKQPVKSRRPSRATEAEITLAMLAEVLGSEKDAEKCMRALPGVVITIPPMAEVEQLIALRRTSRSINYDPSPERLSQVQQFFGVDRKRVSTAYERTHGETIAERRERDDEHTDHT